MEKTIMANLAKNKETQKEILQKCMEDLGKDTSLFVTTTGKTDDFHRPIFKGIFSGRKYVDVGCGDPKYFQICDVTGAGEPDTPIYDVVVCREVTEKFYDNLLGSVPPVYIGSVNNKKVVGGFACSEEYCFGEFSVILQICFEVEKKYYTTFAEVFTDAGSSINSTYNHHYKRGYKAIVNDKCNQLLIKKSK